MQTKQLTALLLVAGIVSVCPAQGAGAAKPSSSHRTGQEVPDSGEKVFWTDPGDIAARDLLYGQGGIKNQPAPSGYQFEKEDMDATNPKFNVRDEAGHKWKIKLGDEAKPETVATRFVWAVGFTTDEDYLLPQVQVKGLPDHLHRGRQYITADGVMQNARLERDIPGMKKLGPWKWSNDPFTGTREWNGLRVMMALINNWDLKDVNNSIYAKGKDEDKKQYIYVVTDLGASFGPTHLDLGRKWDKGDLSKFQETGFIRKTRDTSVDFTVPDSPSLIYAFSPITYFSRRHLNWLGRDIPREDARWMGSLLVRLTPKQIRDAFRAGGYSPAEVESFAAIMEQRIASLTEL